MFISQEIRNEIATIGGYNIPAIAQQLLDLEIGTTLTSNEEIVFTALYGHLTAYERAVLKGAKDNDYGDAFQGDMPWVFAVIESSGLDPKIARGAISSLTQKGVIAVDDYGGGEMVLSIL